MSRADLPRRIDMMLSYIDSHPDTDTDRYADALADLLLAAMAR